MKDYHINIIFSEEDGAYVADFPDLARCSALGATAEEALREVAFVKVAWLESAKSEGRPIPAPRYRPAVYELASTP